MLNDIIKNLFFDVVIAFFAIICLKTSIPFFIIAGVIFAFYVVQDVVCNTILLLLHYNEEFGQSDYGQIFKEQIMIELEDKLQELKDFIKY